MARPPANNANKYNWNENSSFITEYDRLLYFPTVSTSFVHWIKFDVIYRFSLSLFLVVHSNEESYKMLTIRYHRLFIHANQRNENRQMSRSGKKWWRIEIRFEWLIFAYFFFFVGFCSSSLFLVITSIYFLFRHHWCWCWCSWCCFRHIFFFFFSFYCVAFCALFIVWIGE